MSKSYLLRFITQDDVQVEESPWGPHEWISREGLTEADHLLLVRVTMPPGKAHAFHRHPCMEEIIYVVAGTAEQWVDRDSQILGPGDAAHIPMDMVHGRIMPGMRIWFFWRFCLRLNSMVKCWSMCRGMNRGSI